MKFLELMIKFVARLFKVLFQVLIEVPWPIKPSMGADPRPVLSWTPLGAGPGRLALEALKRASKTQAVDGAWRALEVGGPEAPIKALKALGAPEGP